MMRKSRGIIALMAACIMFMTFPVGQVEASQRRVIEYNEEAELDKEWTIKFSKAFAIETINKERFSIMDSDGIEIQFDYEIQDEKTVKIIPSSMYKPGEEYTVTISREIKDKQGNGMTSDVEFQYTTKSFSLKKEKDVIGWDYGKFKDSFNYILQEESSKINEKTSKNILKSISPTLFIGEFEEGEFKGFRDNSVKAYIDKLKKNGYELIPTIQLVKDDESFSGYDTYQDSVNRLFEDDEKEDKIIKELVSDLNKLEVKRVIIDFEALGNINKDGFSDFIEKLRGEDEELVIDVCVAYPSNNFYFNFINVEELQEHVDSFIFMAYDERVTNTETIGSISSYGWVKRGLDKLIELGVDKKDIILAVPLYTMDYAVVEVKSNLHSVLINRRVVNGEEAMMFKNPDTESEVLEKLTYGDIFVTRDNKKGWYEVEYKDGIGYVKEEFVMWIEAGTDKKIPVGWNPIPQKRAYDIIEEFTAENKYSYEDKQNIIKFKKSDRAETVELQHYIWGEDDESFNWKLKLVEDYELKGISFWRLGYEEKKFLNNLK